MPKLNYVHDASSFVRQRERTYRRKCTTGDGLAIFEIEPYRYPVKVTLVVEGQHPYSVVSSILSGGYISVEDVRSDYSSNNTIISVIARMKADNQSEAYIAALEEASRRLREKLPDTGIISVGLRDG